MKVFVRKAAYVSLCVLGLSCGKKDDSDTEEAAPLVLTLAAGLEKARTAINQAAVPDSTTLKAASLKNLLACDSSTKGGLGDCWTEAGWFAKRISTKPANDKVPNSVLAKYSGNMFLACFAQVGVDAKTAADGKDTKGYPKNGSYSFQVKDATKADVIQGCGITSEQWDEELARGLGELSFTAEVSDTTDTTLYDKKMVFVVEDEVATKIELLLRYTSARVRFLMRQTYKNDASVYNSGDRVLFDYNITDGLASYEYLSPLPYAWSNGASIEWNRLLIDENNDEAYLAYQQGTASASSLAYTSAFKFSSPASVAVSVLGRASVNDDASSTSFQFTAVKSGCAKPDFTGVVSDKDNTVACELTGEAVDSAGFSALYDGVKTLAFTDSNAATLLPASETVGVGFGKTDFFSKALEKN